ncbi:hypothetical protein COLO4_19306 [Corchorus olitorius]|uniref:Uncharacterized protein n=1 Tax=Corchorus olitorius TaxID=93759 RepID=A0A1R3J5W6_9ROSI|nr:hypothetical protein COLO4_19306 [Corchorus olitorius]
MFYTFSSPLIIKGNIPAILFLSSDQGPNKHQENRNRMQIFKKLNFLHFLLSLTLFFATSIAQLLSPTKQCGNIELQTPLLSQNLSISSPLNRMIKCKSQKLYFRTSIGLFPISAIDYVSKTITVSHPSCSSSQHYVSPAILSEGFPSPPQPNSLLLFNCSNKRHPISSLTRNCSHLHICKAASKVQEDEIKVTQPYSCLLVQDVEKLDIDFHPSDLSCTDYRRVHRSRSLTEEDYGGVELGTRISFDVPDHVPDICNECRKPNGNCGVGLRCICHAKECKDKVVSAARSLSNGIIVLFPLISVTVIMNFWKL